MITVSEKYLYGLDLKIGHILVTVCGKYSHQAKVISGIPQGSVLGPLLFLIYVNDLPAVVENAIKLFADNTKVYRVIESYDAETLQQDLLEIMKWSKKWQLPLNITKCKIMLLGPHNKKFKYDFGERNQNGELSNPKSVNEEKNLGVRFDDKLQFSRHISEVVSKRNQRSGLVRRNFHIIDNEMFLLIYSTLIRPVLGYCNSVWMPKRRQQIPRTSLKKSHLVGQISGIVTSILLD